MSTNEHQLTSSFVSTLLHLHRLLILHMFLLICCDTDNTMWAEYATLLACTIVLGLEVAGLLQAVKRHFETLEISDVSKCRLTACSSPATLHPLCFNGACNAMSMSHDIVIPAVICDHPSPM